MIAATERALLTYEEAARVLGLSSVTVGRMVKRGELVAVGKHTGRRITRASLDRYCGAAK